MRARKRHTAQPMLELMEARVALSVTAIHVHPERAMPAHVGHDELLQGVGGERGERTTRRCETSSSN